MYPEADEQRCWNHKLLNVLARLPKRDQAQAKLILKRIPYAETRKESERLRNLFCRWCEERGHESASADTGIGAGGGWLRSTTIRREHWQHLRTHQPGGIAIRVVETED